MDLNTLFAEFKPALDLKDPNQVRRQLPDLPTIERYQLALEKALDRVLITSPVLISYVIFEEEECNRVVEECLQTSDDWDYLIRYSQACVNVLPDILDRTWWAYKKAFLEYNLLLPLCKSAKVQALQKEFEFQIKEIYPIYKKQLELHIQNGEDSQESVEQIVKKFRYHAFDIWCNFCSEIKEDTTHR